MSMDFVRAGSKIIPHRIKLMNNLYMFYQMYDLVWHQNSLPFMLYMMSCQHPLWVPHMLYIVEKSVKDIYVWDEMSTIKGHDDVMVTCLVCCEWQAYLCDDRAIYLMLFSCYRTWYANKPHPKWKLLVKSSEASWTLSAATDNFIPHESKNILLFPHHIIMRNIIFFKKITVRDKKTNNNNNVHQTKPCKLYDIETTVYHYKHTILCAHLYQKSHVNLTKINLQQHPIYDEILNILFFVYTNSEYT